MIVLPKVSQCASCRHFTGVLRGEQESSERFHCDAFPRGIGELVVLNRLDHHSPIAGDNGIQWAPKLRGKVRKSAVASGVNCGTGAGGFQPGNTCGKKDHVSVGDQESYSTPAPVAEEKKPEAKPKKPKKINSAIGKTTLIDTSKWIVHSMSAWASNKIAEVEKQLANGAWDKLAAMEVDLAAKKEKYHNKFWDAAYDAVQKALAQKQGILVQGEVMDADHMKLEPSPATDNQMLQIKDMQKVGEKLGTMEGGKFKDKNGQVYYVKIPKSNDRARNEVLACKLYALAGASVLPYNMIEVGDGKLGVATKWHDAGKVDWSDPQMIAAARENFAIHAWLANWDCIGAGAENPMDNQRLVDGKMTTLDAGGALLYRGMGEPKGDAFGTVVTEIDKLRESKTAGKIFGGMTPNEIFASAEKVTSLTTDDIDKVVMEFGPGTHAERANLATLLVVRRNNIESQMEAMQSKIEATTEQHLSEPLKGVNEKTPVQIAMVSAASSLDGELLKTLIAANPAEADFGNKLLESMGELAVPEKSGVHLDPTVPVQAECKSLIENGQYKAALAKAASDSVLWSKVSDSIAEALANKLGVPEDTNAQMALSAAAIGDTEIMEHIVASSMGKPHEEYATKLLEALTSEPPVAGPVADAGFSSVVANGVTLPAPGGGFQEMFYSNVVDNHWDSATAAKYAFDTFATSDSIAYATKVVMALDANALTLPPPDISDSPEAYKQNQAYLWAMAASKFPVVMDPNMGAYLSESGAYGQKLAFLMLPKVDATSSNAAQTKEMLLSVAYPTASPSLIKEMSSTPTLDDQSVVEIEKLAKEHGIPLAVEKTPLTDAMMAAVVTGNMQMLESAKAEFAKSGETSAGLYLSGLMEAGFVKDDVAAAPVGSTPPAAIGGKAPTQTLFSGIKPVELPPDLAASVKAAIGADPVTSQNQIDDALSAFEQHTSHFAPSNQPVLAQIWMASLTGDKVSIMDKITKAGPPVGDFGSKYSEQGLISPTPLENMVKDLKATGKYDGPTTWLGVKLHNGELAPPVGSGKEYAYQNFQTLTPSKFAKFVTGMYSSNQYLDYATELLVAADEGATLPIPPGGRGNVLAYLHAMSKLGGEEGIEGTSKAALNDLLVNGSLSGGAAEAAGYVDSGKTVTVDPIFLSDLQSALKENGVDVHANPDDFEVYPDMPPEPEQAPAQATPKAQSGNFLNDLNYANVSLAGNETAKELMSHISKAIAALPSNQKVVDWLNTVDLKTSKDIEVEHNETAKFPTEVPKYQGSSRLVQLAALAAATGNVSLLNRMEIEAKQSSSYYQSPMFRFFQELHANSLKPNPTSIEEGAIANTTKYIINSTSVLSYRPGILGLTFYDQDMKASELRYAAKMAYALDGGRAPVPQFMVAPSAEDSRAYLAAIAGDYMSKTSGDYAPMLNVIKETNSSPAYKAALLSYVDPANYPAPDKAAVEPSAPVTPVPAIPAKDGPAILEKFQKFGLGGDPMAWSHPPNQTTDSIKKWTEKMLSAPKELFPLPDQYATHLIDTFYYVTADTNVKYLANVVKELDTSGAPVPPSSNGQMSLGYVAAIMAHQQVIDGETVKSGWIHNINDVPDEAYKATLQNYVFNGASKQPGTSQPTVSIPAPSAEAGAKVSEGEQKIYKIAKAFKSPHAVAAVLFDGMYAGGAKKYAAQLIQHFGQHNWLPTPEDGRHNQMVAYVALASSNPKWVKHVYDMHPSSSVDQQYIKDAIAAFEKQPSNIAYPTSNPDEVLKFSNASLDTMIGAETPKPSFAGEAASANLPKYTIPSPVSSPNVSMPAMPKSSYAPFAAKIQQIYDAASKGVEAVTAVKTSPDAKSPYAKKAHEYKQQVLAALQSGATIGNANEKSFVGQTAGGKIDPAKFPPMPNLTSKNVEHVAQNKLDMNNMLEKAKDGNLPALKAMAGHPSGKVNQWLSDLIEVVQSQLHPPKPIVKQPLPAHIADLSKMFAPIKHIKKASQKLWGMAALGYVDNASNLPTEGTVPTPGQMKSHISHLLSLPKNDQDLIANNDNGYVGPGRSVNKRLRNGEPNSHDIAMAKSILANSLPLEEGTVLMRNVNVPSGVLTKMKNSVGVVLEEPGMSSTQIAGDYSASGTNAKYKIVCGPGVRGIYVQNHPDNPHNTEWEVVLPANTRYVLTKATVHGASGKPMFVMYALPTLDDQCCAEYQTAGA